MRRGNGVASAWARILSAAMRRPLPALLLAAALLTGCGGGGDKKKDEGVKNKDTVTVGHNQPIAFGASEYKFEPKNVIVNSGTTQAAVVRFVMRNNGSLAHDLHVEKDGQDLGGTPIFAPGKTESGQATLAPGKYDFLCTVGDHAALGMKGTLTVTSKKTTRPADPDAGKPGEKDRPHVGGQG
jgi:plastocyanin